MQYCGVIFLNVKVGWLLGLLYSRSHPRMRASTSLGLMPFPGRRSSRRDATPSIESMRDRSLSYENDASPPLPTPFCIPPSPIGTRWVGEATWHVGCTAACGAAKYSLLLCSINDAASCLTMWRAVLGLHMYVLYPRSFYLLLATFQPRFG